MAEQSKRKRIYMLDELRGFAILCMILHHTFLDIGDVLGFSWGYKVFDALCTVQPLFWAVFIIISGICSRLSRNTIKRGFIRAWSRTYNYAFHRCNYAAFRL